MEKVPTKGRERELTGGPETVLTIAMEEVLTLPMENLLDIHICHHGRLLKFSGESWRMRHALISGEGAPEGQLA